MKVNLGKVKATVNGENTITVSEGDGIKIKQVSEDLSIAAIDYTKKMELLDHTHDTLEEHILDYNNPHRVTAEQIGAALKNHGHDLSDITTGVLAINRGGTSADNADDAFKNLSESFGYAETVNKGSVDMNTLLSNGMFSCSYTDDQIYLNTPLSNNLVERANDAQYNVLVYGDENYKTQIAFFGLNEGNSSGRVWYRYYYQNNWSQWHELYSSNPNTVVSLKEIIGTSFANSNLLINGDFRFWQRGTYFHYTSEDTKSYGPDRWKLVLGRGNRLKVTKDDHGFIFDALESNNWTTQPYLIQYIEWNDSIDPLKCKFTMSVSVDGTIGSATLVIPDEYDTCAMESISINDYKYQFRLSYNKEMNYIAAQFHVRGIPRKVHIDWIKCEINDTPSPFIPKPYDDEYNMCRRYYQLYRRDDPRCTSIMKCLHPIENTRNGYMAFTFEFYEMRCAPTIIDHDCLALRKVNNINNIDTAKIKLMAVTKNSAYYRVEEETIGTDDFHYVLATFKDGYIEFDAEIY